MAIDRPDDGDVRAASTGPRGVDAGSIASDMIVADEVIAAADFTDDSRRYAYHAEYRAKVDAVCLAAARERWEEAKPGLAAEWRQYAEQHPSSPDVPLNIDQEVCGQIERGCTEIRETEENIVTPAMSRIEAEDPERKLVGLEFRCKGQDRIMEKVANWMAAQSDLTPEEALAMVKDPIRYTFQYTEDHYKDGIRADVDRLTAAGFELVELRNSWASEEYKGINSRWRVPENGQLFEVQFHTEISFNAKQLTHPAYERFRIPSTSETEQTELANFQRRVNVYVPEPQEVREIPDYP